MCVSAQRCSPVGLLPPTFLLGIVRIVLLVNCRSFCLRISSGVFPVGLLPSTFLLGSSLLSNCVGSKFSGAGCIRCYPTSRSVPVSCDLTHFYLFGSMFSIWIHVARFHKSYAQVLDLVWKFLAKKSFIVKAYFDTVSLSDRVEAYYNLRNFACRNSVQS